MVLANCSPKLKAHTGRHTSGTHGKNLFLFSPILAHIHPLQLYEGVHYQAYTRVGRSRPRLEYVNCCCVTDHDSPLDKTHAEYP